MNRKTIVTTLMALGIAGAGALVWAQQGAGPAGSAPATLPATQPAGPTEQDYMTLSYGIGQQIAGSLKQLPFELNQEQMVLGLQDALKGAPAKYTPEQLVAAQQVVRTSLMVKAQQEQQVMLTKNKTEGEAFRTENGKKEGVKTLESGVQIQTLKPGTGKSPTATDQVTVHYTGKLVNGETFDSSRGPDGAGGEPVTFPLAGVIPGWTEALQLMKVGETARIVIPSEKGYGENGSPPVIPPGATLVFEVEMISIGAEKPATQPAGL